MSIKGSNRNQTKMLILVNRTNHFQHLTKPQQVTSNYIFPLFSPPNRRGGEKYCFGADPFGVGVLVVHCLHSDSWTNRWSLTKLAQTQYWEGGKKWLDFGDTDLIFKVIPALWIFQILTKKAFLHPISWSKWRILTKTHIYCNVDMD